MPVNIFITDTKFYNEFKNDPGFVSNPADFATNLAGLVMEQQKVIYQVDVQSIWISVASQGDGLTGVSEISPGVLQLQRNTGKKWKDDGFSVGDTVLMTWTDATSTFPYSRNADATITSITTITIKSKWW